MPHFLNPFLKTRCLDEAEGGSTKPMKLTVWTSTLHRAIATSQYLPQRKVQLRSLDEIDAGKCDGMTYEEIGTY